MSHRELPHKSFIHLFPCSNTVDPLTHYILTNIREGNKQSVSACARKERVQPNKPIQHGASCAEAAHEERAFTACPLHGPCRVLGGARSPSRDLLSVRCYSPHKLPFIPRSTSVLLLAGSSHFLTSSGFGLSCSATTNTNTVSEVLESLQLERTTTRFCVA